MSQDSQARASTRGSTGWPARLCPTIRRRARNSARIWRARTASRSPTPGGFARSQPQNDRVQVDATIALPLTQRVGGSLIFTMEAGRYLGLNGLANGALRVPGNSGWRATLFTSLTGSWRLADRARPRAGGAEIDLLDGGTLDGRGGRARWEVEGTVGVSKGAVTLNSYWEVQGPTRVRDPLPASDLRFSGRTWIVLDARADVGQLVPRGWTRQMTINLTVENLLNDRIDVRDATGAVPNRFQPAYLDPVGRSVRLGVRKLF